MQISEVPREWHRGQSAYAWGNRACYLARFHQDRTRPKLQGRSVGELVRHYG